MPEGKRILRQAFKRLEQEVPERLGRMMRWLRHPASRFVRIPVGVLLVLGGVFSILPGLGIWMLPLGLLLIASDVPFLRRPIGHSTIWAADRWAALRHWLSQHLGRLIPAVITIDRREPNRACRWR